MVTVLLEEELDPEDPDGDEDEDEDGEDVGRVVPAAAPPPVVLDPAPVALAPPAAPVADPLARGIPEGSTAAALPLALGGL